MSGRILIVDTVATNRIVLKGKMQAAQFSVDVCATQLEAEALIATRRPDLILINLSDPDEIQHSFCRELRDDPDTSAIAIIAVAVPDTASARFAALDAGADDALPRPISDAMLMARIRSLLRVRSASQELLLRDDTSRALGFEEARSGFDGPGKVALLSTDPASDDALPKILKSSLGHQIQHLDIARVLSETPPLSTPDLFVIDASSSTGDANMVFGLISDLRARSDTRLSAQLVMVPPNRPDVAAMFLDLGADDVVLASVSADEIRLRVKALISRKQMNDRLRDTVRNGLNAAVTDPLTGLYNRRYVEPHLERMADRYQATGEKFAVMMLDIDHFKRVNDTYGHAAGDEVLVELAERLRRNVRAIDLVARVGGEEFLVAMPRSTPAQARRAADRLRRLITQRPFDTGGSGPSLPITISVGVAVSDGDTIGKLQLKSLQDKADAALYVAKSTGRDQVVMSKSAA